MGVYHCASVLSSSHTTPSVLLHVQESCGPRVGDLELREFHPYVSPVWGKRVRSASLPSLCPFFTHGYLDLRAVHSSSRNQISSTRILRIKRTRLTMEHFLCSVRLRPVLKAIGVYTLKRSMLGSALVGHSPYSQLPSITGSHRDRRYVTPRQ